MATFEYLHFALSIPSVGDLFDRTQEPSVSRTDFLTALFSDRIDFFYRGTLYVYVPVASAFLPEKVMAGFVGKQVSSLEPKGPEDHFALAPHKSWRAAFISADISPTRQVVAMERRQDVGSTEKVLRAMAEKFVSDRKGFSWHIDIEYVTDKRAFSTAASRFRGQITSLEFTFNPANALRGFDKFKEFDKIAQQQTNAEKSEYALKNPAGGIEPSGDFVESAVDYATEGAGRIKMKHGSKTLYDSRQSKRTKAVPESYMPREGEPGNVAATAQILLGDGGGSTEALGDD